MLRLRREKRRRSMSLRTEGQVFRAAGSAGRVELMEKSVRRDLQ